MSCAIAAKEHMIGGFIDAKNAFQTVIAHDISKRVFLRLPPLYIEWFKAKWPNHPVLQYAANELVIQSLKGQQGKKDAGFDWFELLYAILMDLGLISV